MLQKSRSFNFQIFDEKIIRNRSKLYTVVNSGVNSRSYSTLLHEVKWKRKSKVIYILLFREFVDNKFYIIPGGHCPLI